MATSTQEILNKNSEADIANVKNLIKKFPVEGRNQLVLIMETADGRGDFKHLEAFAFEMIEKYPDLKTTIIISISATNMLVCKSIIRFIRDHGSLFHQIFVVETDMESLRDTQCFTKEYQEEIETKLINPYQNFPHFLNILLNKTACVIMVSCINIQFGKYAIEFMSWVREVKKRKIPCSAYAEYGAIQTYKDQLKKVIDRTYTTLVCMGFSENTAGIRLIQDWKGEITEQKRIDKLFSISNKGFLSLLLGASSPGIDDVNHYVKNRTLFPGYLQTKQSAILFILIQVLLIRNSNQKIDFYLSHNILDFEMIKIVLSKLSVSPNAWIIIDSEASHASLDYKIRIFTNKIELTDVDYKKLFYFSDSCAASSGDDVLSTILSSGNLPFFISPEHYIKSIFLEEILEKVKSLGFLALTHYIGLLNNSIVQYKADQDKKSISCPYNHLVSDTIKIDHLLKDAAEISNFLNSKSKELKTELLMLRSHLYENCDIFHALHKNLSKDLELFLTMESSKETSPKAELAQQLSDLSNIFQNFDGSAGMEAYMNHILAFESYINRMNETSQYPTPGTNLSLNINNDSAHQSKFNDKR